MRPFTHLALAFAAASCTPFDEEPSSPERSDAAASSIIFGTPDEENQATVLVKSAASRCTGVLVAREGSKGFVLTAAHCDDPVEVFITAAMSECELPNGACLKATVTRSARHPSWVDGARSFDLQVVEIDGLVGDEQVVPIGNSLELVSLGTPLEFSGFGLSNNEAGVLVDLKTRLHSFSEVATLSPNGTEPNLNLAWAQSYDGPAGGMCSGDSGGPIYVGSGAEKRVIGVHSSGFCDRYGLGVLLAHLEPFIQAFISEQPLPAATETCDTCTARRLADNCASLATECVDDEGCLVADTCYTLCPDQACRAQCLVGDPGAELLAQIVACGLEGCEELCGVEAPGSGAGGDSTGGAPSAGGAAGSGGTNEGAASGSEGDTDTSSCALRQGAPERTRLWPAVLALAALGLRRAKRTL